MPVATYGAESPTLNKGIAKRLAGFEREFARRMCGRTTLHENWRKSNNKELLQLFGYLDIGLLSFVGICRLNWTGHVNRMNSKRKVKYLIIIPREVD
jgi:hypothetical protein